MGNVDSLRKLDAMLLEGLDSGKSVEMTDELWEQMRSRLVDKLDQSKNRSNFLPKTGKL